VNWSLFGGSWSLLGVNRSLLRVSWSLLCENRSHVHPVNRSLKYEISFVNKPSQIRAFFEKRPSNAGSLSIVATIYVC